jgi:hypothetical protein
MFVIGTLAFYAVFIIQNQYLKYFGTRTKKKRHQHSDDDFEELEP